MISNVSPKFNVMLFYFYHTNLACIYFSVMHLVAWETERVYAE